MSQLNISTGKRGRGVASTSASTVSALSSSTDLASLFECPVCFDYVLPPILQCQSGHLVCTNCRPKLSCCPTCRGPLGNIRNLAMEKVASNVMFPCKYSTSGCTVSLVHTEKADHEDACEFRPYSCPCPGASCKWQGSLEQVMPHLIMSHKSITTLQGEDIVFLATDINLPGAVDWVMMQSCFGHHFMLVLEKQEKYDGHQQFFAIVQLIGSRKQAENFAYRDRLGGPKYKGTEDLTNKVVIVTGANSGIGKETTLELAKRNAKVIMACRDMEKCEMVRRNIVLDSKNKYVYCRKCDLASQESIRNFVTQFKKEHDKLHILINNAGVMRCPKSYTKEGIEMQLGVNYMGHFLLTNLLLDVLKVSAPSRIVNLASRTYRKGQINMKDLNFENDYDEGRAYSQSKLAVMLFTHELANRLKDTNVTVNAVYPGIVDTNITRHMFVYRNIITKILLKPIAWPFIKDPMQGAQTVLYAALDPSLAKVSGCYIQDSEIAEVSEDAKDENMAKWLWKVSEKWTKLNVM
ncbi:retinol dehydrogenase 13-like isoform X3 [Pogonomyrmex barbatus]|uniref:RING-type E3 ubiquitin transferase n=1 Tax=Pogonomyrmex barbatus TaxID=144034 RepID=A0A6I9WTB2_9HYME|nr:retinol dehydrogenase 13-like isoform X3 [Pogonomyrmex barbatus]